MKKHAMHCTGFTLMELVASISLLLIFIGGFLLLLGKSYTMIFDAGKKSQATFEAQSQLEKVLSQKNITTSDAVTLHYGNGQSVDVEGGFAVVTSTQGEQQQEAKTFIPFAPEIDLYILPSDGTTENLPPRFWMENYATTQIYIACVNFEYDILKCQTTILNENGEVVDFYRLDTTDPKLLKMSFEQNTAPPASGTYQLKIQNDLEHFEVKGTFYISESES